MYFFGEKGEEKEALGFCFGRKKKRFFLLGRKQQFFSPQESSNKNKRDLKRSKGIIKIIRLNNKNNINNKKRYK